MTKRGSRESSGANDAATPANPARLVPPTGQGAVLQHWLRSARRLVMPHAVIVEGAAGIGKTAVMQWLAAALQCPSDLDEDGPCGVCRTCSRIAAGRFPDVHVVDRAHDDRDQKEWKKSYWVITVDQVRAAQDVLLRRPVEGRARVLLIADADSMEDEAQNALLKTLEEPGEATFLVLEARRPERLLATVRSRAQRLRVVPLDDATVRAEILRRAPGRAAVVDRAVALAHGSLGLALHATTERAVQIHDLVLGMLSTTKGLRPVATARAALADVDKGVDEVRAAQWFLWLLRSELRRRIDALAEASAGPYVAALAEPWTTWLESTLAAERDLELRIPPEQVLTACLVECEVASR